MKISTAIEGYWLARRLDLSPNTIRDYGLTYQRLVVFSKDMDIERITSNQVRQFLQHLGGEYSLSKRTLSNAWIALASLWAWASNELKIPNVVRGHVEQPKFTDRIPEPLEKEEIQALIRVCERTSSYKAKGKAVRNRRPTALRDAAIILVLTDTGIRASELCDLLVSDYDQKRGRLHVRKGKGQKERFLPIGIRTQSALWRYLANREDVRPTDSLFATRTFRKMDRNNLRHLLDTIGKNAKVTNVHPHRFRHTFAIEFLRNGGSMILLKELLGHESMEMVTRYVHIAESDIANSIKHSPADNWRL